MFRSVRAPLSIIVVFTAVVTPFGPGGTSAQPGQFDVDPEAAERALERALVQTGSVLLPARQAEVVPFFGFQRNETEVAGIPVIVNEQITGSSFRLDRNEFTSGLTLRTGLPWAAQVELTVPFAWGSIDQDQRVLGAPFSHSTSNLSGLGDVALSYAQSLTGNDPDRPNLIAGLTWDSDTGDSDDQIFLGSGFNEVQVSLTGTTRQDPLVFSGRVAYQRSFEHDDVQPGDQWSVAAGAFLAVNPATSLQFGLSVAHTNDLEIGGDAVSGTDQLAASLSLGLATVVRQNMLLDVGLSVGLTEDAPDFGVAVSLPIRFTL